MEAELISVDEAHSIVAADYNPKVRQDVARRIAHMAGVGLGMELDPKPYWKLNTALTTSPQFFAYAYRPRFSKAEAMERLRNRYGA